MAALQRCRMNGGDIVAQVLERHGVRFLFTLCGGHISPIVVGAKARGLRVIDVRHEATAGVAAGAGCRVAGLTGVAAVTPGPGVTNTLTAVKNAQLAQSPLVLLGGATATLLRGRGALQDIDQIELMAPHVKLAIRVKRVRDLAPSLARAFRVAAEAVPGPVFVECPVDLLYDEKTVREMSGAKAAGDARGLLDVALRWIVRAHVARTFRGASRVPPYVAVPPAPAKPGELEITHAARLLRSALRPVILLGSQATLGGPARARRVGQAVERLGIPAYLSGMARGLLGRRHPLFFRHHRAQALKEADLVILAGVPCDFRLNYGLSIARKARVVALNRGDHDARMNRRPTMDIIADPAESLFALAEAAPSSGSASSRWLATLRDRDEQREREIVARANHAGEFVDPVHLLRTVESALGDASILVGDGGDFVATASYIVTPRAPLAWLDPGVFGTLGVGAGYALAAKLVCPESDVWLLWGDGSAGYGLVEVDTFVRHGIGVLALVGNDASWGQIARDQVPRLGDDVATTLRRSDYDVVAAGFGATGMRIGQNGEAGTILAKALEETRRGRPVVVNAHLARTDFRKGSISM